MSFNFLKNRNHHAINLNLHLHDQHIKNRMPPRVPAPSHRHAAPSGPWPWMDLDSEIDPKQLEKQHQPQIECPHINCYRCWEGYPQSLFGNWTPDQVKRSGIAAAIQPKDDAAHIHKQTCILYSIDMDKLGRMTTAGEQRVDDENKDEYWNSLIKDPVPDDVRVRCYFLDNMTGPVLQTLGTKFNIEPFFFSSSLSWIPARYQEDLHSGESDHITITLTFLRMMQNPMTRPPSTISGTHTAGDIPPETSSMHADIIDTQSPLPLRSSDKILLLDLLAIHMIRNKSSSTIISFHPTREWRATSAKRLWSRVRFAGQSVYWQKIFESTQDATFLLLAIIWHALYAWDEALETLYGHICWLESRVISTNDTLLAQELHVIRAHLLHWQSLVDDLQEAVKFVLNTPNPVMESLPTDDQAASRTLMEKECNNLLSEIKRLQKSREMQNMRLKNVMNLVFSTVNMEDSKQMKTLTQATVRDSAAMKQISYLSMIFLPATFVAGIFGMNVKEINPGTNGTLPHYVALALSFTALTIYLIVAVQSKHYRGHENASLWERLWWPITFMKRSVQLWRGRKWKGGMSGLTGFGDEGSVMRSSEEGSVEDVKEDNSGPGSTVWPPSFA